MKEKQEKQSTTETDVQGFQTTQLLGRDFKITAQYMQG